MKQTPDLDNACGLIAGLHLFGNNTQVIKFRKDSIIQKFFDKGMSADSLQRAKDLEDFAQFKEVHNVFDTIRDQYNGADGGYVSLEFDYTDGLSENDYLAKVPKNRQERFEITVAQDLGAIMSFFDKRKINGTILSTVKHNNASDIQLFDAVNNYTVGYTVKFMEEGI